MSIPNRTLQKCSITTELNPRGYIYHSKSQNILHHNNQISLWLIAELLVVSILSMSMKQVFTERGYLKERDQPQAAVRVTKWKVTVKEAHNKKQITNIWIHDGLLLSWIHTGCDTYAKHLHSASDCSSILHQHSVLHVGPAVITIQFNSTWDSGTEQTAYLCLLSMRFK